MKMYASVKSFNFAKITEAFMLMMLTCNISALIVSSVTVRFKIKSSKTNSIPAIAMGTIRSR